MSDPRYSEYGGQVYTGPQAGPPYPHQRPYPPQPGPPVYPPSGGPGPGYPPAPDPLTDTGRYQRLPGPRDPGPWDAGDSDRDVFRNGSKQPNGFALAGLIFGLLGNMCALGWICSLIGLTRAKNLGTGRTAAWTGLLLSTAWVAVGWYVIYPWYQSTRTKHPSSHVVAGLDPGCIGAMKLFEDPHWKNIGKDSPTQFAADLQLIIATLNNAAGKSTDPAIKAAISKLATDYRGLADDVKAKRPPSESEKAAGQADAQAIEDICANASPSA